MSISINIKSNNFTGDIVVNQAEERIKKQVIQGFFEVAKGSGLGIATGIEVLEKNGTEDVEYESTNHDEDDTMRYHELNEKITKGIDKGIDEVVRNRQLPLIGSERRENVSIGESLGEKLIKDNPEQPDYWKTGIKTDDNGRERYKLRYWCECGGKGNHYIPLGTEEVYCHDCNNIMVVENATNEFDYDGVPIRDDYGNFYIARHK